MLFMGSMDRPGSEDRYGSPGQRLDPEQSAISAATFALIIFAGLRGIQMGVRLRLKFTHRLPEDDAALHAKSTKS